MEPIYIVGGGNHAKVVIDIIEAEGRFEIAGIFDRGRPVGERLCGYEYLGDERAWLRDRAADPINLTIALGENFDRLATYEALRALSPRFCFPVLTHPAATIARRTEIGEGCTFMAGSVLNPFVRMGAFCILNTNAAIDHDSVVGDFVNICPGVATGGGVRLGNCAFVGVGANLRDSVTIGENAQVGVGAAVVADIAANALVQGVPARHVRWREPGERFMDGRPRPGLPQYKSRLQCQGSVHRAS
jgi:sugar O-acyltransferase (sialic acid O-acetyltransferase NeuD family)